MNYSTGTLVSAIKTFPLSFTTTLPTTADRWQVEIKKGSETRLFNPTVVTVVNWSSVNPTVPAKVTINSIPLAMETGLYIITVNYHDQVDADTLNVVSTSIGSFLVNKVATTATVDF